MIPKAFHGYKRSSFNVHTFRATLFSPEKALMLADINVRFENARNTPPEMTHYWTFLRTKRPPLTAVVGLFIFFP